MKKITISFLLILLSFYSSAQVYKVEKPMTQAFTNYAGFLTLEKNMDGILFYNQQNTIFQFKSGLLSSLPPIPVNIGFDSSYVSDIELFDNKLYVSGVFDDFNSGTTNYGIIYLDAGQWQPVTASKNIKVRRLTNSGNFLYGITASYNFKSIGGDYGNFVTNNGLIKMDKSQSISVLEKTRIENLSTFNKDEIVFTKFPKQKIFRYNGTNYDSLTIPFTKDSSMFSSANSGDTDVYFRFKKYIFLINQSFALKMLDSSSTKIYSFPEVLGVYEGALYFNDIGYKPRQIFELTTKSFKAFYGLNDSLSSTAWVARNDMMNYGKFYTITHPQGGLTQASEVEDGALLSGCVFEDLNHNCKKDKGEQTKQKLKVELSQGGKTFLSIANDTGYYQIVLPAGTYDIAIKSKNIKSLYDSCGGNKVLKAAAKYYADIPFSIPSGVKDIGANVVGNTGFLARRGFTENYQLHYSNFGSTTENITLKLEYPDSVKFISSSISPTSQSSNLLTFSLNNIKKLESGTIKIEFELHAKKQLNSYIQFVCNTLTKTNDKDSSDNTDTLQQRVVAAIDPNKKQSFPEGAVSQPVTKIKYVIRFQNEGNYFARKVTVVDTFDARFPLTKLQMTGSKHPYSLRVEKGNILIWEFNNINLPPKSDGDEVSQGFIAFEAPLAKPLGINETIQNRAHIYFDYEDPLPTPYTSISMVQETGSIKTTPENKKGVKIFPNPVQGQLQISAASSLGEIRIINSAGIVVFNQREVNLERIVETENWSKGLYFVLLPEKGIQFKIVKF
jgi:hypothetical protein